MPTVILFNKPFARGGPPRARRIRIPAGCVCGRQARPRQRRSAAAYRQRKVNQEVARPKIRTPADLPRASRRNDNRRCGTSTRKGRRYQGLPHKTLQGRNCRRTAVAMGKSSAGTLPRKHPYKLGKAHAHRRQEPSSASHDGCSRIPHAPTNPHTNREHPPGRLETRGMAHNYRQSYLAVKSLGLTP